MLLAVVVAFVPAGGNAANTILTAITIGFLAAISWTLFVLSRQNELTLAALRDSRRAILYGALGLIALLIAGSEAVSVRVGIPRLLPGLPPLTVGAKAALEPGDG